MELGIVDMEANFVPGSGNQMGVEQREWWRLTPLERLGAALDVVSQSEFQYVELGVPWVNEHSIPVTAQEVQALVSERGLKVGAYCSLVPGDIKSVGPEADPSRLRGYLERAFANCDAVGGSAIVYGSGASRNIPDGYPRENALEDVVGFLQLMDEIIAEHAYSFKIAIEPLNTGECNFINSLGEAYEIACLVDSPAIGVLLDTFHAWRQPVSMWQELPEVADKLYHVHLAQPEDRGWPGHMSTADSFEFGRLFQVLKNLSYAGKLSVECLFEDLKEEITPCHQFLSKFAGDPA